MWKVVTFCILLAFSGIVSWWADELPWLRKFEYQLWDLRTELVADPQNARKDIKIVVIDQRSLNALEKEDLTWPWPRPIYKPVVEWLKGAGAKGIGFDILFTETGVSGLVDDREFASAFTRDFPAVHVASAGDGQGSIPVDLPLASISPEISAIISKRSFSRATFPIEELYPGTSIVGLVTVEADEDGIFRRMPLGATVFGKPFYSLAFALYAATHKDESIDWVAPYSTDDGSVIVRLHGGSETFRTYSFADVLAVAVGGSPSEEITAEDFKGSYVLVGVWAPGLQDLRPVSLGRTEYRGVEFHAATLDNILSQSFVTETSRTIDVLFGVFLTALVSSCVLFLPTPALSVVIASLVVVAAVLFTVMLADAGVWIALAAPLLSVVTAITGSLWLQFLFEGRQRKFLRRAFSHYVNPSIVSQIVNDPTHLSLGGQKKRVSVYFSDLAGFTTLSEKLSTEQLTHFLNWYLGEMTEIVLREDGTLDKYEGDA
ncbi:MAG: adenylate/guanylate cyclase domain-containing protein, partial [Bdellovibrionales bacterium]|nr:adenylate/guanylate cyclase domain-containing protein [Bdellovibrionales bacterium]